MNTFNLMKEMDNFVYDASRGKLTHVSVAEQEAEKADFYKDMEREMETPEWAEAESQWQAEKDEC